MDITKIEKRLLDDEIEVFETEVREGLKIIRKAFARYAGKKSDPFGVERIDTIRGNFAKELNEYFASFKIASGSYFDEDYTHIDEIVPKLPDAMKKAILDYAVKQFFEKLNGIQEVIEETEG